MFFRNENAHVIFQCQLHEILIFTDLFLLQVGEGRACSNLGIVYQLLGEHDAALKLHQAHLSIARQLQVCVLYIPTFKLRKFKYRGQPSGTLQCKESESNHVKIVSNTYRNYIVTYIGV